MLPVPIHLIVVLLIVAAGDIVQPVLVVKIPPHRLLYPFLELEARLPPKFPLQLSRVYRVSHVVPFPVGNVCDKVHVLTFRSAEKPVNGPDQHPDDINVLPLVEPADIVCLGYFAFVENKVYSPRMVLHVKPVAHVLALAVHRERPAVPYVVDEQRDQLLRKLVRPVVVRTVGNYRRHAVGVMERPHEMVAPRLARRVRAVRLVFGVFREEIAAVGMMVLRRGLGAERGLYPIRVGQLQRSVYLVRGDVVEAARN